jgi:type I restriction enzyme S subunit
MGSMNWYGELPDRWKVRRIVALFSEVTNSNADLHSDTPMQFRYGEIIRKKIRSLDDAYLDSIRRYTLIKSGDILINGLNLNYDFITQRVAIAKECGCITPAYICIRAKPETNAMFYCYVLKYMDSRKILNGLGSGIRLTLGFSDFKNVQIPVPPGDEQAQIVRYLDWKVSSINSLINGKKKQIELLKEKRKSVINEEFQKIGRQNHSCIQRLKNKVSDINEKASPIGSFYIGMENIVSWLGQYIDTGASAEGDCKKFQKGDILFGKLRPYLAKAYTPDRDGVCSGEFLVLRGYDGYLPYLKYLLLSNDFVMLVNASTYGAKMPRANWTFIGNCYSPFPSIEEQKNIVNKLDVFCTEIDNLSAKLQQQIKLLEELRTSLVSDVVTGKIDVRGVAVPEFETVEEAVDREDDITETEEDEQ